MTTLDAKTAYANCAAAAEEHDADVRYAGKMEPGDFFRQGDVYVVATAKIDGKAIETNGNEHQMAPGNTPGSRHILKLGSNVRVVRPPNYGQVTRVSLPGHDEPCARSVGDSFQVTDGMTTLTHPEHPDWVIGPGCYDTFGQVDGWTWQRVKD